MNGLMNLSGVVRVYDSGSIVDPLTGEVLVARMVSELDNGLTISIIKENHKGYYEVALMDENGFVGQQYMQDKFDGDDVHSIGSPEAMVDFVLSAIAIQTDVV